MSCIQNELRLENLYEEELEKALEEYKDKIEKSTRKDRENVLVEAFKDFIVKL